MDSSCETDLKRASIRELASLGAAVMARRRGDAEDAVRLGCVLFHVREAKRHEEDGFDDFLPWVRTHLRLGQQQAERYIDARRIPLDLVRGRAIDVQSLAVVVAADPALWPVLLEEAEEADRARLHRAVRAAEAHLVAGGAMQEAQTLARRVARGEIRVSPAPRAPRRRAPMPAELGGRLVRRLRQVRGELQALQAHAMAGRRLKGRWTQELPAEVGDVVRCFAELAGLAGLAPGGLLAAPPVEGAERRLAPRVEEAAERDAAHLCTRVQEDEKGSDVKDLIENVTQDGAAAATAATAVPEGPDPALVPGATEYDVSALALAGQLRRLRAQAEAALGPFRAGEAVAHVVQEALLGKGNALQALGDRLLEEMNEGALAADREAEETEMAQAARAEQLRQNEAHLLHLGAAAPPATWSILGWHEGGRPVALSRDRGQVIMLMGVPGSGKSRAAVGLCEAALQPAPGLTSAEERRTAVVLFHADPLGATLPEVLAGLSQNGEPGELRLLAERLGLGPAPIARMNLAVPAWLLPSFRARLGPQIERGLRLVPLVARPQELGQAGLEALLGMGSDAHYVERLLDLGQREGAALTARRFHELVDEAEDLPAPLRRAAHRRLKLLDQLSGEGPGAAGLWDLCAPGELTVLLLGDAQIGTRDALPLSAALMAGLSQPSERHGPFQRVFYLDEVNRFDRDPLLWQHLVATARLIRHLGSSLVLCGQDFLHLPDELFGLCSIFGMFRVRSPRLYEHVRDRLAGFRRWSFEELSQLPPGWAAVAAAEATDPAWHKGAQRMYFRPLRCEHGGAGRAEL